MTDERLKIWIELGKWAVISVGLVIMTKIIDTGFKDREVGLIEIKEYDKYVSMVTDNTKLSERRLLAQYFAHVTPSEKLKEGWESYFKIVDKEFQELKEKKKTKQNLLSVLKQKSDSMDLPSPMIQQLKADLNNIEDELTPTFNKNIKSNNYESALDWERLGFESLVNKDLERAITAFESSENNYNSFHQVYEIARYLKNKRNTGDTDNDVFWQEIYQKVLEDFSWKMPASIKPEIEKRIQ